MKERLSNVTNIYRTRRNFLGQLSAIGAAGLASGSTLGEKLTSQKSTIQLVISDFETRIGDSFQITREDNSFEAELVRVIAGDDSNRPVFLERRQSFSILLKTHQTNLCKEGSYRLEHSHLGRHDDMLIVSDIETGLLQIVFG
jgi:hypothetical protein